MDLHGIPGELSSSGIAVKKKYMKKTILITLSIVLLMSCKKENDPDAPVDTFDRSAMLSNMGYNLIIPNYQSLKISADSLQTLASQFVGNPTLMSLEALRDQLLQVHKDWVHCSVFEFGPAANVLLRQSVNTFPADTSQIQNNIASGTWDLATAANIDAKGLPAFDYLMFRTDGNDAVIMNSFTIDANAAARKNYLAALALDLKTKVDQVLSGWEPTGGNYISTFINSTGTDVGSSLGFLVNQLNYDYEITKNPRIGIPLGKQTLNVPLPEKCENYYSGTSLEITIEHMAACRNIFSGTSRTGTDGSGLDDYLDHLNVQSNGTALSVAIKNKFGEIIAALQAIPGPLSDAVVNNDVPVETAYTKILECLVMLKTELPSALGILITYQDSDGD